MKILALDVGSSSAKAAVVNTDTVGGRIVGHIGRASFPTDFDGPCVSVAPEVIYRAAVEAIRQIGAADVEALALTGMAPAWVALDRHGEALTDVITHADRRSVAEAHAIEQAIGRDEHLRRVGNRPFPGGISSTTGKWFADRHGLGDVDLVGHLPTLLHRGLTGARAMDVSNAGFTGLWRIDGGGWDDELLDLIGLRREQMPEVMDSGEIAGHLTSDAARMLGLPEGLPVSAGMVDGSGAIVVAGADVGQLVNSAGSTDVLAVCLDQPHPRLDLLTRPLGVGGKWVAVATEAAAGSAIDWARRELFADHDDEAFDAVLDEAGTASGLRGDLRFDPRLAGSRTEIDQPTGSLTGLTLGITRLDMLHAILDALTQSSIDRLHKLESLGMPLREEVVLTGGLGTATKVLHRHWPSKLRLRTEQEATARGAAILFV